MIGYTNKHTNRDISLYTGLPIKNETSETTARNFNLTKCRPNATFTLSLLGYL